MRQVKSIILENGSVIHFTEDKEVLATKLAELYVVEKNTVRGIAQEVGRSKSSVHFYLKYLVPYIKDKKLAKEVAELLAKNKAERATRGGLVTQKRWKLMKQEGFTCISRLSQTRTS